MLLPLVTVHGETGTVSRVYWVWLMGILRTVSRVYWVWLMGKIDNCLQSVLLLGLAYGETGNCLQCTGFGSRGN